MHVADAKEVCADAAKHPKVSLLPTLRSELRVCGKQAGTGVRVLKILVEAEVP